MRVLVWSFKLIPTQARHELLVRDLANGLVERVHTIRIIGPAVHADAELHTQSARDAGCGPEVIVDRLAIHRAFEQRDLRALLHLRRVVADIVETFDPDVVHMHGTGPDAFLYLSSPASVRADDVHLPRDGRRVPQWRGIRVATARLGSPRDRGFAQHAARAPRVGHRGRRRRRRSSTTASTPRPTPHRQSPAQHAS